MADDNKLGIARVIVEGIVAIITAIFVNKSRKRRKEEKKEEVPRETMEDVH